MIVPLLDPQILGKRLGGAVQALKVAMQSVPSSDLEAFLKTGTLTVGDVTLTKEEVRAFGE